MRCPNCKNSSLTGEAELLRTEVVAGVEYRAHLPGWLCANCNGGYVKAVIHKDYQKRLALAVSKGPPQGDAFRIMRRWLGISQLEMQKFFGVRGESICRWERGRRKVPLSAWYLLAVIVQETAEKGHSSTLDRLYELNGLDPIESLDLYKGNPIHMPPPKRGRPRYVPI